MEITLDSNDGEKIVFDDDAVTTRPTWSVFAGADRFELLRPKKGASFESKHFGNVQRTDLFVLAYRGDDLPDFLPFSVAATYGTIGNDSDGNRTFVIDFAGALRAMKEGARVARAGWNGKGMWIAMSPGNPSLEAGKFWAGHNRAYAEQNSGSAPVFPCFTMKTATGEILMGCLTSLTDLKAEDMIAEDWRILDGEA